MLTGDHCCFDIRGGLEGWAVGDPDWGKKCCSNQAAPVKQPPDNINQDQLDKVRRESEGRGGDIITLIYIISAQQEDKWRIQKISSGPNHLQGTQVRDDDETRGLHCLHNNYHNYHHHHHHYN